MLLPRMVDGLYESLDLIEAGILDSAALKPTVTPFAPFFDGGDKRVSATFKQLHAMVDSIFEIAGVSDISEISEDYEDIEISDAATKTFGVRKELWTNRRLCASATKIERKQISTDSGVPISQQCRAFVLEDCKVQEYVLDNWADALSGFGQVLVSVASALQHKSIKLALDQDNEAALCLQNLISWVPSTLKNEIPQIIHDCYSWAKGEADSIMWMRLDIKDEQKLLEALCRTKAYQVMKWQDVLPTLLSKHVIALREKNLSTLALFNGDTKAWWQVWAPVHDAMLKAFRFDPTDDKQSFYPDIAKSLSVGSEPYKNDQAGSVAEEEDLAV